MVTKTATKKKPKRRRPWLWRVLHGAFAKQAKKVDAKRTSPGWDPGPRRPTGRHATKTTPPPATARPATIGGAWAPMPPGWVPTIDGRRVTTLDDATRRATWYRDQGWAGDVDEQGYPIDESAWPGSDDAQADDDLLGDDDEWDGR